MVELFTTSSFLKKIYYTDELSVWRDIIQKLGKVYIDSDNIPEDENDPLFLLDMENNIKIDMSKKDFINSVSNSPETVLNEPCGIFLLDISTEKAKEIQSKYGVVCESVNTANHTLLTQRGYSVELIENQKNKKNKCWRDIFKRFKTSPTNSVLIIDAYLFANDKWNAKCNCKCYDTSHSNGANNLKQILDQILPAKFGGTYHIGIFLNKEEDNAQANPSRLTNKQIATKINKLKNGMDREYDIDIEVIFVDIKGGFHELIHNRRILTNTYILETPYKLAAFKEDGSPQVSQTIQIRPLFEQIDIDTDSDPKEKRLRADLDDLKKYIKAQYNAQSSTDKLYRNGKLVQSFEDVIHRFLIDSNE